MLPFIVRSADESIRADLVRVATEELNRRIAYHSDNEIAGIDQQHDLAHSIVAVVANNGPENTRRVVAFAKQWGDTDAFIATYAQASILAYNFDNVFAVSKWWSGP